MLPGATKNKCGLSPIFKHTLLILYSIVSPKGLRTKNLGSENLR